MEADRRTWPLGTREVGEGVTDVAGEIGGEVDVEVAGLIDSSNSRTSDFTLQQDIPESVQ